MNVKDFEYFVEIYRHKSISKAASRLYISQPTLSKFLQRMEAEFNTPLFHRMGKQFVPTPAGQCLFEKAQSILGLNQQIDAEIQQIVSHRNGNIYVGLPNSRGEFFVTSIAPEFRRQFPFVKITVALTATDTLIKHLEQGEFDLLFINYDEKKPQLIYHDVGEEEMVLAVNKDSPLLQRASIRKDHKYPFIETHEWKDMPFILASEAMRSGRYSRDIFEMLDISPRVPMEISGLPLIRLAVQQGLGVTLLPSSPYTESKDDEVKYLSIDVPYNPMKIAMVSEKGKHLSEPENALIQIVREKYK